MPWSTILGMAKRTTWLGGIKLEYLRRKNGADRWLSQSNREANGALAWAQAEFEDGQIIEIPTVLNMDLEALRCSSEWVPPPHLIFHF